MGGTRKKVLWVDDEIEFLRSHIMFLETRGYAVVPVFSGDDAIQLLHQNPREFDIVLLDEQMPGKDGLTTLEEIKEFIPDLPVVMVTKSEEEQLMEDALGKKIDGYLTKPVNPSQILSVCKKLLDSRQIMSTQVTQRFVRSFSDSRNLIQGPMKIADWLRLYHTLTQWDLELETVDNEGLRQNHAGQKSDCNAAFNQFVTDHYGEWVKGVPGAPTLSVGVVRNAVQPLLAAGRKVYLIIFDCMRLDQYLCIEQLLKEYFSIERRLFFSTLPTSTLFARSALLSGMYPSEIAARWPSVMPLVDQDSHELTGLEKEMLRSNLAQLGTDVGDGIEVVGITDAEDSQKVLDTLGRHAKKRLVTIVVNFVDMLTQGRTTSALIQEIAPDESAFRALTASWFQHSALYQIFKDLARQDATIVFASDHGSIFCTRPTEMYGTTELFRSLRYKFGTQITADERYSIYLPSPGQYKIPAATPETVCIMAKENYYFTYPDKGRNFRSKNQSSFQYGGISLEEMVVNCCILQGK